MCCGAEDINRPPRRFLPANRGNSRKIRLPLPSVYFGILGRRRL